MELTDRANARADSAIRDRVAESAVISPDRAIGARTRATDGCIRGYDWSRLLIKKTCPRALPEGGSLEAWNYAASALSLAGAGSGARGRRGNGKSWLS
jgi:hypothetical protein